MPPCPAKSPFYCSWISSVHLFISIHPSSIHSFIYLSLYLHVSTIDPFIYPFHCSFIHLPTVCLSFPLCIHPPIHSSLCPSVSPSTQPLSIHPSINSTVHLSLHASIHPPTYRSVHPSIRPPSIHPAMQSYRHLFWAPFWAQGQHRLSSPQLNSWLCPFSLAWLQGAHCTC